MITKNNILMISLLIFWSNSLLSQIDFARNLYCKLVFDEIEIRDSNKKVINQNELFNIFYTKDTVTNCFGEMMDKFHDNLYCDPQLIIILAENEFDTLTNNQNFELIDFFSISEDYTGNLSRNFAFSLDRDRINELKKITSVSKNDIRFLNDDNEYWVIKKIQERDRSIFIDDCHKSYRLNFTNNKTFNQTFQNNESECMATVDLNKITEQKKMPYWNNKVYHNISIIKGQWKTKNNKLYLINDDIDVIKEINYEFNNNTLVFSVEGNYRIELEKIRLVRMKK